MGHWRRPSSPGMRRKSPIICRWRSFAAEAVLQAGRAAAQSERCPGPTRLVDDDGRGSLTLEARSPTAYHVSLASADAIAGHQHIAARVGRMLAPGEVHRFELSGTLGRTAEVKLHYKAINDYGAVVDVNAGVASAAAPIR